MALCHSLVATGLESPAATEAGSTNHARAVAAITRTKGVCRPLMCAYILPPAVTVPGGTLGQPRALMLGRLSSPSDRCFERLVLRSGNHQGSRSCQRRPSPTRPKPERRMGVAGRMAHARGRAARG